MGLSWSINMNDVLWLSGTWFVAASNHPWWTGEKKQAPTYTFTPMEKDNRRWLVEEIKYVEQGTVHTVHGENYPVKNNFKSFTWKGIEPLDVNEWRWEVKLVDETGLWMLTWHEGAGKIPEHIHVLTRETNLEEDVFKKIEKLMATDAVLQKHVGTLKRLL